MKQPLIYIILINYNGYVDTIECIRSLRNIEYTNYKIILVENASNDVEKIKNNSYIAQNTTVILSKENGGFSDGNNIGIQFALENNAEYVLLLNNDTVVKSNFLNVLVSVANRNKKIGITTGNIYFYSNPDTLWYSNGHFDKRTGNTIMCRKNENNNEQNVNFACGCMLLLSADMIRDIGLLDKSFFLYSEDTEYCCRANDNNWEIMWTPEAKIYHKVSASTVGNSDFQKYYLIRNNLYISKKFCQKPLYALLRRFLVEMKDVVIRESSLKVIFWSYKDFLSNKVGKSSRF